MCFTLIDHVGSQIKRPRGIAWLIVCGALLYESDALVKSGLSGLPLLGAALLPMIAAIGIVSVSMQCESIAFSFACTALVTFSYGFLEQSAHAPAVVLLGLARDGSVLDRR